MRSIPALGVAAGLLLGPFVTAQTPLSLAPPDQQVAGAENVLVASGATPGALVEFLAARPSDVAARSSTRAPRMAFTVVSIGSSTADPNGRAELRYTAPAILGGSTLSIQATTGPRVHSDVLQVTFRGSFTVVDLEDLNVLPGLSVHPPDYVGFVSAGYRFDPIELGSFPDLHYGNAITGYPYNGTTVVVSHDGLALSRRDGRPFSVGGFDFAGWPSGNEIPFSVLSDRGVAQFTPDGFVDGFAGTEDFETFLLPPEGFREIRWLRFVHSGPGTNQGLFGIDNVLVTPVPPDVVTAQPLQLTTAVTPQVPGADADAARLDYGKARRKSRSTESSVSTR